MGQVEELREFKVGPPSHLGAFPPLPFPPNPCPYRDSWGAGGTSSGEAKGGCPAFPSSPVPPSPPEGQRGGGRGCGTCEARTCCCRWKGKAAADAPESPWAAAVAMTVLSSPETPADAPETVASSGPIPAAIPENAPPMANCPGCSSNGCPFPSGLKNCWPARAGGKPRFCKCPWLRWAVLSVWTVRGAKGSFPSSRFSSTLGPSLRGLFSSSPLKLPPRVLEEIVAGLCRESGGAFSVLSRLRLPAESPGKKWLFEGLPPFSRGSSPAAAAELAGAGVVAVVVLILPASLASSKGSSLLSASLSPSLGQRSARQREPRAGIRHLHVPKTPVGLGEGGREPSWPPRDLYVKYFLFF